MINKQLTGTWIEGERALGEGSVLAESDDEVLVSVPASSGWERMGRMRAYKPVVVGKPMSLINMDQGESLTVSNIVSASRLYNAYVVRNAHGNEFRLDVLGQVEKQGVTTSLSNAISYVRGRFGL